MQFAIMNKERLSVAYLQELKSASVIAKELATNETKVRRALAFLGVPIRTYAEAQKVALDSGTAIHPTKGKKLSDATKETISVNRSKAWTDLSEDDKEKFRQVKRDQWEEMSPEQKYDLQKAAHAAIRESASIGSKTERYVSDALEGEGYGVIVHARNLIQSQALEVDMFLPELKTAIEIDGPTHHTDVFGGEVLSKTQVRDLQKNGLIVARGLVMLRVIQDKKLSQTNQRKLGQLVLTTIEELQKQWPSKDDRIKTIKLGD